MFRANEELFASFGPAKRLESHTAAIKLKLNLAKEKLPPWAPTQTDIWATTTGLIFCVGQSPSKQGAVFLGRSFHVYLILSFKITKSIIKCL